MLFVMNYSPELSVDAIAKFHRDFGDALASVNASSPSFKDHTVSVLNIGFVSADFFNHPVARLMLPVLQAQRSKRFRWFAYVNNSLCDSVTDKLLQSFDAVRSIVSASDDAFSQQVQADAIHVLIDLSGHTSGNRMVAFSKRMAPVQATWLGYAFTTGLHTMDYVVADADVLPSQDEPLYREKPCRLPSFYLLAGAPDTSMPVSPSPILRQGYATFGSFNNPAKISERVFKVWARLLHQLPTARLLFKNKAFADVYFCQRIGQLFQQQGIDANRLSFEGQSWGDAYFDSFSRIDVALDPFPFPGLMTTLDTLWMGVPLVTLQERGGMLGRHGGQLLNLIGHADWVAHTETEYINKACEWVSQPHALQATRVGVRQRLQQSRVMNANLFIKGFEQALVDMARSQGIVFQNEGVSV